MLTFTRPNFDWSQLISGVWNLYLIVLVLLDVRKHGDQIHPPHWLFLLVPAEEFP
jgi:hypothetical protein